MSPTTLMNSEAKLVLIGMCCLTGLYIASVVLKMAVVFHQAAELMVSR